MFHCYHRLKERYPIWKIVDNFNQKKSQNINLHSLPEFPIKIKIVDVSNWNYSIEYASRDN